MTDTTKKPRARIRPTSAAALAPVTQSTAGAVDTTRPAGYVDITHLLPSRMLPYEFDTLSVRPHRLPELFKIGGALMAGSNRPVIEAVGACLDRPVSLLAVIDFWTVAYWQRLNSYTHTPFNVPWECDNVEHHRRIHSRTLDAKLRLTPDSIKNNSILSQSDIETIPIDDAVVQLAVDLKEKYGLSASLNTTQNMLELMEDGKNYSDEDMYMATFACRLHPNHGLNLSDRIQFLKTQDIPTGALELLKQFSDFDLAAGPKETVSLTCAGCGARSEVTLATTLHTFFPLSI